MSFKHSLTSEQLNQRFENPFALVNYAIELAKVRVQRGEGLDSNPANDVLDLIARGLDDANQDSQEDEEDFDDEDDLE